MNNQNIIKTMSVILLLLIMQIIYQNVAEERDIQDTSWIENLGVSPYTNQLIIVEVLNDEAFLSFYEKDTQGEWREVLRTPAVIGENGIGKVREGDGRTPIGVYYFTNAFGILENPGTNLDYVQVDETHYWVDDNNSKYYNQFVSTNNVEPDWTSAEHICEYGELYHYVLSISYNIECIPGLGSAIFLHCTNSDSEATAGCIAVSEEDMRRILQRIESGCVLIIDTEDAIQNY